MPFYSPLRYPGGKRKLGQFVADIVVENELGESIYVEPFAGGCAIGLKLLLEGYVRSLWINDKDDRIACFWDVAINATEEICRKISNALLNVEEWERQRTIYQEGSDDPVDLAFSTLYLNRTNRSGVLGGGVVGGKSQSGRWKLSARFNPTNIIERIEAISERRDCISVTNLDGIDLLDRVQQGSEKYLLFLDPPYYSKSDRRLYKNELNHDDHVSIARKIGELNSPWLLTYDDCMAVRELYDPERTHQYSLNYTAGRKRLGAEIICWSSDLSMPSFPPSIFKNLGV